MSLESHQALVVSARLITGERERGSGREGEGRGRERGEWRGGIALTILSCRNTVEE